MVPSAKSIVAGHPAAQQAGFAGLLQADAYAGSEKLYGSARTNSGPISAESEPANR
jgi:hypothetical protein